MLGWSQKAIQSIKVRQAFLHGYDNALMEGHWPAEEDAPGYRWRPMVSLCPWHTREPWRKRPSTADGLAACTIA